jgi:hypothetical protein
MAMAGATAAAGLNRLTGYRAGKLRANELQAEARLSLFAIDQFSLSSPRPPSFAGSMVTRETPAHCPAPRNETRSVCFQPGPKPWLHYSLYKFAATVTTRVIEHTSPAPILRWVPVA